MEAVLENKFDYFDTSNVKYVSQQVWENKNKLNDKDLREAFEDYDNTINVWEDDGGNGHALKLLPVLMINNVLQIPYGWRRLEEDEIIQKGDQFRGSGMIHWYPCEVSINTICKDFPYLVIRKNMNA